MNTLKELVNKIYTDLQKSDWIEQYPDLAEKDIVADIIQNIALDMMPNFVQKTRLEEFVEEIMRYYYMGDYEKSLNYLNKAEEFAKSDDEKYLVNYNRAIIYYNKLDKSKAPLYANKAKTIKYTKEIMELMNAIKQL